MPALPPSGLAPLKHRVAPDQALALFSAPGVVLVRPDGSRYCRAVQTMPFARRQIDELLTALDFVMDKDYPAPGEHAAAV